MSVEPYEPSDAASNMEIIMWEILQNITTGGPVGGSNVNIAADNVGLNRQVTQLLIKTAIDSIVINTTGLASQVTLAQIKTAVEAAATQATLAQVKTAVEAAATEVTLLLVKAAVEAGATEATLLLVKAAVEAGATEATLQEVKTAVEAGATEATLLLILSKIIAAPATAANQTSIITLLTNLYGTQFYSGLSVFKDIYGEGSFNEAITNFSCFKEYGSGASVFKKASTQKSVFKNGSTDESVFKTPGAETSIFGDILSRQVAIDNSTSCLKGETGDIIANNATWTVKTCLANGLAVIRQNFFFAATCPPGEVVTVRILDKTATIDGPIIGTIDENNSYLIIQNVPSRGFIFQSTLADVTVYFNAI